MPGRPSGWPVAAIPLLLAVILAAAPAATSSWRHQRRIEAPPGTEGTLAVPLDPKIYDRSRSDLADLRVLDSGGAEVGYRLQCEDGASGPVVLQPRIYNRGHRPGESATATLDFGARTLKDALVVKTPGHDFRRGVRVEASADGESWETIQEGGFLLDVPASAGQPAYRRDRIELPAGDQRYLKVTLLPDPADPPRIDFDSIHAERTTARPPLLEPVPLIVLGTAEDPRERVSEILLDTGARGRPLHALWLEFAEKSFRRRAELAGRDQAREEVSLEREGASDLKVERETSWRPLTEGILARAAEGTEGEPEPALYPGNRGFRYLRIRIYNEDDPPLRLLAARADAVVCRILFTAEAGHSYRLAYGNPGARAPRYEASRIAPPEGDAGPVQVSLGPEEANPEAAAAGRAPAWTERHPALLWSALLAAVALLAWLIRSLSRGGRSAGG